MKNRDELNYCFNKCAKGKEKARVFLDINDSVFDAVEDFKIFIEECKKTCDKEKALNNETD